MFTLFFVFLAWFFGTLCGWLLFPVLESEYIYIRRNRQFN